MVNRQPILLVDDTADDVDLCTRSLKKAGVLNEIIVAEDGIEGLDYLFGTGKWAGRNPGDLPAVVLLDLKMPRLDGLEVLSRIRSDPRTRLLPVVILTSSREEPDIRRGYDLGVNAFVQKPVEFAEFSEAMKHLGMFWILTNVHPGPATV